MPPLPEKKFAPSDNEQVSCLALLGLCAEEKEKFGRQLNEVLLYMGKIEELPLEGVGVFPYDK